MDTSPKKLTAKKRRKLTDNSFHNTQIHGGDAVINELPHRVLSSIISLLPVKQAVATSAVCRNWRNLWRYLVRLDINVTSTTGDFRHVVDSQLNRPIDRCEIVIMEDADRWNYVSWVETLRDSNSLLELQVVHKGVANFTVPIGFYRNLQVVEIDNNHYPILGDSFVGCENLETLKLTNVVLREEALAQILNQCTKMESLALVHCLGLVDFMITKNDCRLKYLEIDGLRLNRFEFRLINLRVLCVARFMCESHSIQCPNLSVLRTSNSDPDILSRFSGLMGSQVWSFHNLRELSCSLNLDKWSDLILLRYIFRASQNLQYLDIINKVNIECGDSVHQALPYPQQDFWKGEETDRLKVVHIRGFQCREKEMLLASHFIKNEESLVKLAIQFDPIDGNSKKKNSITDAKRVLSLMERASKGAFISFSE